MKWIEVKLLANNEQVHMLSNIFMEAGIGGVLEEITPKDKKTTLLTAYVFNDDLIDKKINKLKDHLSILEILGIDVLSTDIKIKNIEDEDWANSWKKFFKPFNIGKFVIKPTWEEYIPKDGEFIIELDPGMAFGTGQHPTTQLCIEAMSDYLKKGNTIIDAGTGSGILCIAADQIGMSKAYAFDNDTIASDAAKANFKRLGIEDKIIISRADNPCHIEEKVDMVLANIIAKVILEMGKDLAEKVKDGGYLIASGIIDYRFEEVLAELEKHNLMLVEKRKLKEWVCLVMKKN